jgi:hypothetical protein
MAWNKAVPATTTIVSSSCAQFLANWQALATTMSAQHGAITLSSSTHSAGTCEILYVGTTAQVAALTPAACAVAWDTTLKDVFSFTETASSNGGGFVPSGTYMLFYANTAPTGWTIQNTLDDKLLFVTKGSGAGGQTGGGAHSTGSWTISGLTVTVDSHVLITAEMPAHTHSFTACPAGVFGGSAGFYGFAVGITSTSTGGGGGHTHTGSFTSDAAWRPAAYCYIVCIKT